MEKTKSAGFNPDVCISVIIPVYNAAQTLPPLLLSLSIQDFEPKKFEIIFIDDGSTDGTENIIRDFMGSHSMNMRYYFQQNKGPGAARNIGLDKAKYSIIAFTDSDCIVDPNWLSVIADNLSGGERGVIAGQTYCNEQLVFPWKTSPAGQIGVTANLAIDLSNVGTVRFREKYRYLGEDTDMIERIRKQGHKLQYVEAMKVNHPPHQYSMGQLTRKVLSRQYEVDLIQEYGDKIHGSFGLPFRPMLFKRLSIAGLFALSAPFILLWLIMSWPIATLAFIAFGILIFMVRLYKIFIITPNHGLPMSLKDRGYTLVTLAVYPWLLLAARAKGSVVKRYLFI